MTTPTRPLPSLHLDAVRAELERTVRTSYGSLLRTARRILRDAADAEEAVQDGLLAATRALHQYDGRARLSTWVQTIVRNASLRKGSRVRRREARLGDVLRRDSDGAPDDVAVDTVDPSERLDRRETRRVVREALAALPAEQARWIRWRHLDGLGYREIAARSGVGVGAARVRVHRARAKLRAIVEPGRPISRSAGAPAPARREARTRRRARRRSPAGSAARARA